MRSDKFCVPIYMASVSYVVRYKKKSIYGTAHRVIFKGYSIDDLIEKHMGSIYKKMKHKVPANAKLEITNVNLVKQLDYGVKE